MTLIAISQNIELPKKDGRSVGRAFISLPLSQAVTAIDRLNHTFMHGRKVFVQMARPIEPAQETTTDTAPTTSFNSPDDSSSDVEMDTDTTSTDSESDEDDDEYDPPAELPSAHTSLPVDVTIQMPSGMTENDTSIADETSSDQDTDSDRMDIEPPDDAPTSATAAAEIAEVTAPLPAISHSSHANSQSNVYRQELADDLAPELQPDPKEQDKLDEMVRLP